MATHKSKFAFLLFAMAVIVLAVATAGVFRVLAAPTCPAGSTCGAIAVDSSFNVSVGTTAGPNGAARFVIVASSTAAPYSMEVFGLGGTPIFTVDNNGNATTTGSLSVNSLAGTFTDIVSASNISGSDVFARLTGNPSAPFAFPNNLGVNTSTQVGLPQSLSVYGNGYFSGSVGIGTASPFAKLDVRAQEPLVLANTDFNNISAVGTYLDFYFGAASGNTYSRIQSFNSGGGAGGILALNSLGGNVGIGTTGPQGLLDIRSSNATAPAVFIASTVSSYTSQETVSTINFGSYYTPGTVLYTDASINGISENTGDSSYGALTFSTRNAGTVGEKMRITSGGNVGIGVTPSYKLDVVSGGSTTARFGTASGDTVVVGGGAGKITAGTFDPAYTINGVKYATYNPGMTGVKEETTGAVDFAGTNFIAGKTYSYTLGLAGAEQGSDLWLFKETTQILKNNLNGLVVILTPSFEGGAWYVKNLAQGTVTIFAKPSASAASLEVSYRFTAPRFDASHWSDVGASDAPAGIIIND